MTQVAPPDMSETDLSLIAMLARGYTTDSAARELHLSRHTVGERISLLLERTGCRNRAELVAYCYVHGFLSTRMWPPCRCRCAVHASRGKRCPPRRDDPICESTTP
ncbi:response regulator transcription factor [Plantactinospora sp. KBS50]|uniref:response regulator transcription factor n=1 Tax=Plantactinospora sp. KBS50 TaxID=2024580 RepID=UPI000BAADA92|nr:helix-turn-helix transcriptional regulator [Plantactinospora sp. KBS50]ASW53575.1 hypothetical protein CIK06_04305 [Plantactinospora sp. KBS50]